MVAPRIALIVKEHGTLAYPAGRACAEVLIAGEIIGCIEKAKNDAVQSGVLYTSGRIAGEGIVDILLAQQYIEPADRGRYRLRR